MVFKKTKIRTISYLLVIVLCFTYLFPTGISDAENKNNPSAIIEKYVKYNCEGPWEDEGISVEFNTGEYVSFKLVLSNIDDVILHNIEIIDVLPEGLSYIEESATILPDIINGNRLQWNVDYLASGDSFVIQFKASIDTFGFMNNRGYFKCSICSGEMIKGKDTAFIRVVPRIKTIDIDILPGITPNIINKYMIIPVSIFSNKDFSVDTIRMNTITFLGGTPIRSYYSDVNGDGYVDVTLFFNAKSLDFDLIVDQGIHHSYAVLNAHSKTGYDLKGRDMVENHPMFG